MSPVTTQPSPAFTVHETLCIHSSGRESFRIGTSTPLTVTEVDSSDDEQGPDDTPRANNVAQNSTKLVYIYEPIIPRRSILSSTRKDHSVNQEKDKGKSREQPLSRAKSLILLPKLKISLPSTASLISRSSFSFSSSFSLSPPLSPRPTNTFNGKGTSTVAGLLKRCCASRSVHRERRRPLASSQVSILPPALETCEIQASWKRNRAFRPLSKIQYTPLPPSHYLPSELLSSITKKQSLDSRSAMTSQRHTSFSAINVDLMSTTPPSQLAPTLAITPTSPPISRTPSRHLLPSPVSSNMDALEDNLETENISLEIPFFMSRTRRFSNSFGVFEWRYLPHMQRHSAYSGVVSVMILERIDELVTTSSTSWETSKDQDGLLSSLDRNGTNRERNGQGHKYTAYQSGHRLSRLASKLSLYSLNTSSVGPPTAQSPMSPSKSGKPHGRQDKNRKYRREIRKVVAQFLRMEEDNTIPSLAKYVAAHTRSGSDSIRHKSGSSSEEYHMRGRGGKLLLDLSYTSIYGHFHRDTNTNGLVIMDDAYFSSSSQSSQLVPSRSLSTNQVPPRHVLPTLMKPLPTPPDNSLDPPRLPCQAPATPVSILSHTDTIDVMEKSSQLQLQYPLTAPLPQSTWSQVSGASTASFASRVQTMAPRHFHRELPYPIDEDYPMAFTHHNDVHSMPMLTPPTSNSPTVPTCHELPTPTDYLDQPLQPQTQSQSQPILQNHSHLHQPPPHSYFHSRSQSLPPLPPPPPSSPPLPPPPRLTTCFAATDHSSSRFRPLPKTRNRLLHEGNEPDVEKFRTMVVATCIAMLLEEL